MAIPKNMLHNFEVLRQACMNGDLALLECTDNATGNPVYAICAVNREDGDSVSFAPIATMLEGDPYKMLTPPDNREPATHH